MRSSIRGLLLGLLSITTLLVEHTTADPPPYGPLDAEDFDKAKYGIFSETKYKSTDLVGPRFLRRQWDDACKSDKYYMFCPRGMLVGHPGPMIVDNDGNMVWHTNAWPVAYGLTVQNYKGEPYLTFWSGNDQVIGHGSGYYYMLDKHYNQFKMIGAASNLTGDLHEFKITKDNTAIVTSYRPIPWNLEAFGRKGVSWIWDCYFQEIDIETDQLLFEWKATDYFTFDDCYNPLRNAGAANNPWDWFHINSIDKDKHGNYLISSRYSHALTYIHGRSGRPMWHLGGKNNTFQDLSGGKALNFAWQHDARWVKDKDLEEISLFDNAAYFADQTKPARGLVIKIDINQQTAELIHEAIHPRQYIAESQGSMQILDDERMLVGYGSAAAFAEYDKEGKIQCDVEYGALHYHEDGSFSPGAVMSYRTYKNAWSGHPTEPAKTHFEAGKFYVSWNGATEVRKWRLEGATGIGGREKDWHIISTFPRTGFESETDVDESAWKMYRVTALDMQDRTLGVWLSYSAGEVMSIPLPASEGFSAVFYMVLGALLATIVLHFYRRRFERFGRVGRPRALSDDGEALLDSTPLAGVPYHHANGGANGSGTMKGSLELKEP